MGILLTNIQKKWLDKLLLELYPEFMKNILEIGNPVLRMQSKEVPVSDIKKIETTSFVSNLVETMRAASGAGLAASQIGTLLRIFAMEIDHNKRYPYKPNIPLTVCINPTLEFLSDKTYESYEGCLSVPNLRGVVKRYLEIRLSGYDVNGDCVSNVYKGITAGTVQHEYDHLNGILFIDKVDDPKTLCTWSEFHKYYEESFIKEVHRIKQKYGS